MIAGYLAAVAVLALLTVLPGPDFAVVSRFAVTDGREAGVRAAVGVVAGLAVWGLVTICGLAAILAASAEAYAAVKIVGAAYLLAIGIGMLWRGGGGSAAASSGRREPLRTGATTNLLNPKIAVFYATVLPTLVPPGAAAVVWMVLLVATHAAISLVWLCACALTLSTSVRLARPAVRDVLARVTGVALIGFGLRLALSGRD